MEIKSDKHQNHTVQWTQDGLKSLVGTDVWLNQVIHLNSPEELAQLDISLFRAKRDGDITLSFAGTLLSGELFSIPIVLTLSGGSNNRESFFKLLTYIQSQANERVCITHDQFIRILQ